jgi:predicted Zn-dependent peptidase
MRDYDVHQFPNGIRIVHKQVNNTKIAHCGFIIDIGSRDENPDQQGIAHFWEHMAFKGTKKRKAYHIINRLESVGGELNAFTTKEKICFYASVLDKHFEKALELLKDITFDSVFPENQIENERNVILEEMSMYKDNPEDAIQDDFDQLLFPDHPLGNNILGTKRSVRSFEKKDFRNFIQQNLDTERLIFSSVSNLPFAKVMGLTKKHLSDLEAYSSDRKRQPVGSYIARSRLSKKSLTQSHCGLGRPAYTIHDPRRLPFSLIINILGGPAMNSKLNMALREKYGFVYAIDANYIPFTDTGIFSIFFATEKKQLHRSVDLVLKELHKISHDAFGKLQLHKAKEQFIGQMAMAEENNNSLMLMMGRSLLDLNRIESFESIAEKVKAIRAIDILEIAEEMFDETTFSFIYFVPKEKKIQTDE